VRCEVIPFLFSWHKGHMLVIRARKCKLICLDSKYTQIVCARSMHEDTQYARPRARYYARTLNSRRNFLVAFLAILYSVDSPSVSSLRDVVALKTARSVSSDVSPEEETSRLVKRTPALIFKRRSEHGDVVSQSCRAISTSM